MKPIKKNRFRRRLRRGFLGAFNPKRLSPRQKRRIEKRRERIFQGKLNFDRVRRSNRKRALFGVVKGRKIKVLEDHPRGRTIIDVAAIIRQNSNGGDD